MNPTSTRAMLALLAPAVAQTGPDPLEPRRPVKDQESMPPSGHGRVRPPRDTAARALLTSTVGHSGCAVAFIFVPAGSNVSDSKRGCQ